jgi:ATP-binding cassette subfamily C protein
VARADATLVVSSGADILAEGEGGPGLQILVRALLGRLAAQVARQRAAEASALTRQEKEEAQLDERMYTRLATVLEQPSRRLPDAASGDPVRQALDIVGRAAGIVIREEDRRSQASGMDRLDEIARASGVRWRRVTLEGRWWRQDVGALFGTLVDGGPVALVPRRSGVMDLVDPVAGTTRRIDADVAQEVDADAVVLYRPLPSGRISGRTILAFVVRAAGADLWRLLAVGLLVGLVSLLVPLVTKFIFSTVVPQREDGVLAGLTVLLVVFALATFGFTVVQRQAIARMSGHVATELQAALWDRVLDLPLGFFRQYSSGSLASRVMAIDQIQQLATATVTTSLIAIPIGLCNLVLAFFLEARLAVFGSLVVALLVGMIVWFTRSQARHLTVSTEAAQASFGIAMQLVDGVGKLRVAHAERRAFAQWARQFATLKESFVQSQRGFALVMAISASATAALTLALFLAVATLPAGSVSPASFIAFNTAFGVVIGSVVGLTGVAIFFAQSKPLYASAQPVITTAREVTTTGADPGRLSGSIEVSHVSLRYAADGPTVLDDVSFGVEPGSFVALVGPSGSGKSTMLRVLLGFEQPEVGSVRYDGKDLDSLDVREVRRQIGVVTQSVRLLPGDIFTNIVGNRQLTMDDAWEAAEIAGIANDIRAMPMQMHTFVAEGATTFSGGQRQRLLIARAVAAKPRVLFFDEATSALDNRTQAQVSDALTHLRAARVVIAHRLSTIRTADRILVLEAGRITQEGTFDELATAPGPFAALARRQLA